MSETTRRFPFFDEAETPAGAEGWETMYPYFLVPAEETREHENAQFWFADTMHWSRGCHPFDSIGAEAVYFGAGAFSTRIFALPVSLGLDVRIVNGYVYISPLSVTDPDEIARRAALFGERAGFYYANWNELYEKWKTKMAGVIESLETITFDPLPEFDPAEVVTEAKGRSVAMAVVENYHRLVDEFFAFWMYHFEFLNLGYGGYITFFQFCKQAFPLITDQTIARMVAGVDVLAFRPDTELRTLAALAVELELTDVLGQEGVAPEQTLDALAGSAAGRQWLAAFEEAKNPWFNYFAEYGFTHDQQTWASDLSIPLQGIARYTKKLAAGEDISRPVQRLRAERDEIVAEYRALLEPAEAEQFDQLVNLAATVFPYIEEHNIYVEHWAHNVFWLKAWELADLLLAAGFIQQRDDLFYLNRFELDTVLFDVVESWAIGVSPRGAKRWQAEIQRRRPIVAALQSAPAAPAYGIPPAEVTDPFAVMNYGVTTERVAGWLGSSGSDDSVLTGGPGSLGVVEGRVRVLKSEVDLPLLQPGEILVAPITAPSWAPAFSVAAGVITDIGGMMCHAAIVCREYGLPAVVGTGYATARLRTGQLVRVDGKAGTVTILDDESQPDEAAADAEQATLSALAGAEAGA